MNIDYKGLGRRIRSIREKKNLTQEQLAEKIGLSSNYVSHIELSHSIPSLETLAKICNVFEVTPDYLLLDSFNSPEEILKDEISHLLSRCTPKSLKTIEKLIAVILEEQALE